MGVRTMLEAVPLCQLNGSEAERMLDDLTRPCEIRHLPLGCHCNAGVNSRF